MAGKTCFPGDESCEALIDDSSLDSLLSLGACDLCLDFRFLVSNFDVLIAEKKKQPSLTSDSCKSHSSLFRKSSSRLSQSPRLERAIRMHLKPTMEHCLSTLAITLHSALSRINLLFN